MSFPWGWIRLERQDGQTVEVVVVAFDGGPSLPQPHSPVLTVLSVEDPSPWGFPLLFRPAPLPPFGVGRGTIRPAPPRPLGETLWLRRRDPRWIPATGLSCPTELENPRAVVDPPVGGCDRWIESRDLDPSQGQDPWNPLHCPAIHAFAGPEPPGRDTFGPEIRRDQPPCRAHCGSQSHHPGS